MGTHPNCPSVVAATGESLRSWIEAHPQVLGTTSLRHFGADLPYLFKVPRWKALAVRTPPLTMAIGYSML